MANLSTLQRIAKSFDVRDVQKKAPVNVNPAPQRRPVADPNDTRAPLVTTGEVLKDSRGYSFARASQAFVSKNWENAKLEKHVHETLVSLGYPCEGGVLVPLDSKQLALEEDRLLQMDLPAMVAKGVGAADPEHTDWLYKRYQLQKALGGDTDSAGGFLVQPERAMDIIDVLRDMSLLGRTTITELTLPASGRLELSKTTTDVEWQYVGENTDIDNLGLTDPALGQVNLSAKTAVGLAKLSRQLVSDSTPSAEAWVRNLYASSMASDVNNALIAGTGTNGQPRGILNHPDVTIRVAGTTGANGDTLDPEDVALAVSDCGENNGNFEGWIMRPVMTSIIRNRRADAVSASDAAGMFLFVPGNGPNPATLQGFPIAESTKVPNTRTKGSGTTLTAIIGGMLSQVVYGRMGTLELTASTEAGTSFQNNQMWIRAIRRDDIAIRVASAVVVIDTLLQS